jgi:hypothetical protein
MASEFDFLRVKWPKLAAMAADATRLADVSPSSALLSLRTFCEWATDIALDFYELQVAGGASQIEKLEALQSSGMVPSEILQKFHNVRSADSHTSLRESESASVLVRGCISDCLDVGQWLFREAEKEGWPHVDGYSQSYSSIPIAGLGASEGGGYDVGGEYNRKFSMSRFMRKYGSVVSLVVVVIVIAGIGTGIMVGFKSCNKEKAPPQNTIEATHTPEPTPIVASTATPVPTPEEDPFDYIDDVQVTKNEPTFYFHHWNLTNYTEAFKTKSGTYTNGIGMYIPFKRIVHDQASLSEAYSLGGKYNKISFDLACETEMGCYDIKDKFGSYKVTITADGKEVFNSNWRDYDYAGENLGGNIEGCSRLEITLRQRKGSKGTLNVVMGNVKLYKAEEE